MARRGTFVSGKFDQLHRHTPYSALGHALTQLCRGILSSLARPRARSDRTGAGETTGAGELAMWRRRILDQLSLNAGLIVDIVPELERIVGPQPPVPATGLIEAQHRFQLTLARFLGVFASEQHPLVIFLDDLQWADQATLQFLAFLLRLPAPSHLLIIGAYRDNEVNSAHPVSLTLDELRASAVDLRDLRLEGLPDEAVCELIADAMHRSPAEVRALSKLVAERTSGNPFFVDEFLRTLCEEKVLRFNPAQRAWTCDLQAAAALSITANMADLMVRKLARLPARPRKHCDSGRV